MSREQGPGNAGMQPAASAASGRQHDHCSSTIGMEAARMSREQAARERGAAKRAQQMRRIGPAPLLGFTHADVPPAPRTAGMRAALGAPGGEYDPRL